MSVQIYTVCGERERGEGEIKGERENEGEVAFCKEEIQGWRKKEEDVGGLGLKIAHSLFA